MSNPQAPDDNAVGVNTPQNEAPGAGGTCPFCHGTGLLSGRGCPDCDGTGKIGGG